MGQQAIALYPNMKDLSGGFLVLKNRILPEGMMNDDSLRHPGLL